MWILLGCAGVAVGVLSSISGLGGGFLVVPLLLLLGKEAKLAVGTAFVFIFFVSISSLIAYWRLGQVDLKTGAALALGGMLGAQVGPRVLQDISESAFRLGFGAILVLIGGYFLLASRG
jgi:hypothetical protein